jgi:hypothetical protein
MLAEKKEETKMKYEKPAVLILESAIESILGGGKPLANVTDSPLSGTIHAYESDE